MTPCHFCDHKNPAGRRQCEMCGAELPADHGRESDRTGTTSLSEFDAEIVSLFRSQGKIAAIKRYREATGTGLREAKEAVELLGQRNGISSSSGCAARGAVLALTVVWCLCVGVGAVGSRVRAEDADDAAAAVADMSEAEIAAATEIARLTDNERERVRQLIQEARQSVVVVTFNDAAGEQLGLGSGFVLSSDGLIATNLHVIGEARPIQVRFLDGRTLPAVAVHATDKQRDLAILKVEADGLPALPVADVSTLAAGDPLVAIGNPEGLTHSVVTGVSGIREEVQGMDMIQLAMPIERGNSGGPVLNLNGEVVGLVTLKSLQKENLGFAVPASYLKPLLESPNSVTMSRWLTIGVLNPRLWEAPRGAALWTQRAGRIHVAGTGTEFGGRSLCLSTVDRPALPCEFSVAVRINEDDGAAGVAFHADGGDRHYGFYPSSGSLRLTRFDGPTVYQWNVLRDEHSSAYRPGEWNYLKVRLREDGFDCYCNDVLVYASNDRAYTDGRIGLVKFRHTTAEFKEFRVGGELPPLNPDAETIERITDQVRDIPVERPPVGPLVAAIVDQGAGARRVLEERAALLEQQAARLRELSAAVHAAEVRADLVAALGREEVDLLHVALLIAALDNDELDVAEYRRVVDAMAEEFLSRLPDGIDESARFSSFNQYLFEEQGFHGGRTNYYAAANSYINQVLDDREGLPITLSVLYMELARRCGLDVVGIGLPGHFVVQYRPTGGAPRLIDPFERGRELTELDATLLVHTITGRDWDDRYLEPQSPRQIAMRMIQNLLGATNAQENPEQALRYVDTLLAIDPESPADRLYRAVLCLNTGRIDEGIEAVNWVLERSPEGIVMEEVHRLLEELEKRRGQPSE